MRKDSVILNLTTTQEVEVKLKSYIDSRLEGVGIFIKDDPIAVIGNDGILYLLNDPIEAEIKTDEQGFIEVEKAPC